MMKNTILAVFFLMIAFGSRVAVADDKFICETLLARYTMGQTALESMRKLSSEDFGKRLAGEKNTEKMYADDMIPRLEWEISHITTLYLANNCSPKLIADTYIQDVIKQHRKK